MMCASWAAVGVRAAVEKEEERVVAVKAVETTVEATVVMTAAAVT